MRTVPRSCSLVSLGALFVALGSCSSPSGEVAPTPMRIVEAVDGLHGRIEVLEYHGSLALAIDGVFQTVLPPSPPGIAKGSLLRGGDHIELVPYYRPAARSALILGLGGGLHARALSLYGLDVTAVEIDPEVARIARERFGVECETIVADGRAFLERDPRRFDAVVLDVFAGGGLPEHLFTRQAFELAALRLSPEGILVVHLVGRPGHPAIAAVARTVQSVFPCTAATCSGREGGLEAIYLFASPTPLWLGPWIRAELEDLGFADRRFTSIDASGAPILTDADCNLDALARDIAEEHRRLSLEVRRSPPW